MSREFKYIAGREYKVLGVSGYNKVTCVAGCHTDREYKQQYRFINEDNKLTTFNHINNADSISELVKLIKTPEEIEAELEAGKAANTFKAGVVYKSERWKDVIYVGIEIVSDYGENTTGLLMVGDKDGLYEFPLLTCFRENRRKSFYEVDSYANITINE